MKKYIWIIVLVIVLWIVGAAISAFMARKAADAVVKGLTGVDVKTGADGTVSYSTGDGSVSTKNELPSNWPADAPKYPGAVVTFSGSTNSTSSNPDSGLGVTLTTGDDVAKVTAFYKENLVKQGWELTGDANMNGTATLSAKKDSRQFSVYASPVEEGKTGSAIIISISTTGAGQ